MDRRDPQTGVFDIWLNDLARGTSSRFTSGPGENQFPIWSPDGSHIAFYSSGSTGTVRQRAISGTARDEVLDKDPTPRRADDWSRDGRYLTEEQVGGKYVWILPLFGDRKPFAYLQGEFRSRSAKFSPDGQWVAYASTETGRDEVYVATFPSPTSKWQVSTNGGGLPVWSRDGKELFFVSGDSRSGAGELMAVEIRGAGSKFSAGVPKALFAPHFAQLNPWYDVSKDGRFLIPTQIEQTRNPPITVVVNWQAGLKK